MQFGGGEMFFWKRQSIAAAAEAADAEPEMDASARLRRIVGSQRAPAQADIPMPGGAAALSSAASECAFLVLGLPLDASATEITQRVDDLAFEPGAKSEALDAARAALLGGRSRLDHELLWLPECTADEQGAGARALKEQDAAELARLRDGASGLARLNLTLFNLAFAPGNVAALVDCMFAAAAWDAESTLCRIDEARLRGGHRPVDPALWERAASATRSRIADRLAAGFASSPDATLVTHLGHRDQRVRQWDPTSGPLALNATQRIYWKRF